MKGQGLGQLMEANATRPICDHNTITGGVGRQQSYTTTKRKPAEKRSKSSTKGDYTKTRSESSAKEKKIKKGSEPSVSKTPTKKKPNPLPKNAPLEKPSDSAHKPAYESDKNRQEASTPFAMPQVIPAKTKPKKHTLSMYQLKCKCSETPKG